MLGFEIVPKEYNFENQPKKLTMNTLVTYYSHTGNNRFLARQIAEKLEADIEEIKPLVNAHLLLLSGLGLGIKKLQKNPGDYDRVIVCGPVWMGSFIYPLRKFMEKYQNLVKEWLFISCCGSSYKLKDDKYGHEMVFRKIKKTFPELNIQCRALPITMTMPDDKQEDPKAMMETRLTEENFKGLYLEKFNELMREIA